MAVIKRKWLNNLLARVVVIFSSFSIKPHKIKKVLEFLFLKTANRGDKMYIIRALILFEAQFSKLLFKPDFISLNLQYTEWSFY